MLIPNETCAEMLDSDKTTSTTNAIAVFVNRMLSLVTMIEHGAPCLAPAVGCCRDGAIAIPRRCE
jgi:hypothetical protein